MKKYCVFLILLLAGAFRPSSFAQDTVVGVTVPITITGNIINTERTRAEDPGAGTLLGGFRALITPQVTLGSNWSFYSAVQVRSEPFFFQDAYSDERGIQTTMLRAYFGYRRSGEKASVAFRIGKLSSAFGSFPLRYDDAQNSLMDQPLSYTYLTVRPDQIPCGVGDFSDEHEVEFHCGGPDEESYGIAPVTLYGLPGAEVDLSWSRLDARFQVTNSSPAHPLGLSSAGQSAQWTAGTGYTIHQGFRVGISAFHGPWLDAAVKSDLPAGSNIKDFPATGLGVDVQWAGGSWSANGEWNRFAFRYPRFQRSPVSSIGYAELKRIINPRWFLAARANFEVNNRIDDSVAQSAGPFVPNLQTYELALAFRPNRFQLVKVGYEWVRSISDERRHDNVLAVQFVTSISAISKVLK